MKVSKCKNGHYFDVETYQTCPLCGAEIDGAQQSSEAKNEPNAGKGSIGRLFKKKNKTTSGRNAVGTAGTSANEPQNASNCINVKPGAMDGSQNISDVAAAKRKNNEPTIGVEELFNQGTSNNSYDKDRTIDIWDNSNQDAIDEAGEDVVPAAATNEAYSRSMSRSSDMDAEPGQTGKAPANDVPQEQPEPSASLAEQVRKASSSSDGKTMSFFSAYSKSVGTNSEAQKSSAPLDPVVGWLVCISGEHLGESFNIFSGMNTVGRSVNNKISIRRDLAVSREKHAVITFEPKHRDFYIKPGDSSGLTYVNGEYIMETKKLNDRDIVEIGNSRLMFVPLCNERFAWEDYINAR